MLRLNPLSFPAGLRAPTTSRHPRGTDSDPPRRHRRFCASEGPRSRANAPTPRDGAKSTALREVENRRPRGPSRGAPRTRCYGAPPWHADRSRKPRARRSAEVAPNVLRMQLPIRMPGLGHVNCYAILDARGAAIVDPGLPGPGTWRAIQDRLRQAGLEVRHVHTVIVTHSHPDHFGGAARFAKESGATVVAHRSFSFGPPVAARALPEVSVEDLAAPRAADEPGADETRRAGSADPAQDAAGEASQPLARRPHALGRRAAPAAAAHEAQVARAALDRQLDHSGDHAPGRARRRARARRPRVVRRAHARSHVRSLLPPRPRARNVSRRRSRAADDHAAHLRHLELARSALLVLLLARPGRRDRGRAPGAAGPRASLLRSARAHARRSSATTTSGSRR